MRRMSLWQSLSLAYGSLATLVIVITGLLFYFLTSFVVTRTLHMILSQTAKELIENHLIYQEGQIRYKRAETGLTINGFLRGTGVSALIYDEHLNRIGTYGLYRNLLEQHLLPAAEDRDTLTKVLTERESQSVKVNYGKGSPYEVLYVPIALNERVVGVLQMAISARTLEQLQVLSGYLIVTILPISLLVMWLVAFSLGKTWLVPLYKLIHLMQATETHKLVDLPKLPTSAYPEIDALQKALKQLLGRIHQNLRAQTDFTAHAAHELKTPLAQAVSGLDVVLPVIKDTDTKEHLLTVKQDLLALGRKVESLLALTLMKTSPHRFTPRLVEMKKTAQEVIEMLTPMAKKQGIVVTSTIPPALSFLMVPDHAQLMLANLLTNAIKYNKRKGTVEVRGEATRTKVILTIKDTGFGIARKEQTQLFTRFFRSPKVTAHIPGYGIGLALVYSIATRSKIAITIDSQPGKGTSVVLTQKRPDYSPKA